MFQILLFLTHNWRWVSTALSFSKQTCWNDTKPRRPSLTKTGNSSLWVCNPENQNHHQSRLADHHANHASAFPCLVLSHLGGHSFSLYEMWLITSEGCVKDSWLWVLTGGREPRVLSRIVRQDKIFLLGVCDPGHESQSETFPSILALPI